MFVASDGNIYFTGFLTLKIAASTRASRLSQNFLSTSLAGPAIICVETSNRYIYFAMLSNVIGPLDTKTTAVKSYIFQSPLAFPAEDTVDGKGRIWFLTATQNTLNQLDPASGNFINIKQPETLAVASFSLPFYFEIASNYGPGDVVWFTEATNHCVGRYKLD